MVFDYELEGIKYSLNFAQLHHCVEDLLERLQFDNKQHQLQHLMSHLVKVVNLYNKIVDENKYSEFDHLDMIDYEDEDEEYEVDEENYRLIY